MSGSNSGTSGHWDDGVSMDRMNFRLRTFARRPLAAAAATLAAAAGLTVGVTELGGPVAEAAEPQTFVCQGGAAQTYVVPPEVTSVRVRVEGAGGGSTTTGAGGAGGAVTATVAVEPGQFLGVVVGCSDGPGLHWGGDGGAARGTVCVDAAGGRGGGSSAVLTADFDEVVAEAGGGGGAGGGDTACGPGGVGGTGSRAGQQGGDGAGDQPAAGGRGGFTPGGHGNDGGQGRNPGSGGGAGGGGGGGGCRGGDGGTGGRLASGGGGGGGSSCAGRLAVAADYERGVNAGDGRVTISPDLMTATGFVSDVRDDNGNGRQDVGDVLDYSVTVHNEGGTRITGVTVKTEIRGVALPLTCAPAQPSALRPGAELTCSTSYRLTTQDIVDRAVVIESVASGRSVSGADLSASTGTTVRLNPAPALALTHEQSVVDRNGNALTDAGDVIDYRVGVANAGGGRLTDVRVDSRVAGVALALSCTPSVPATLAVGAALTCTAQRVITDDDMAALDGQVQAVASASARAQNGAAVVPAPVTAVTRLDRKAELTVTNTVTSVVDVDRDGRTDAGDEIRYAVGVTNTGTLVVSDVTVAQQVALDCAPAGPTALRPGAGIACTGTYPITQADADLGAVTHTAVATGRVDGGEIRSAGVPATTPIPVLTSLEATSAVSGVVDVNENDLVDAGDEVRYTVEVTNGGTVTITALAVDMPSVPVTCPAGALPPGGTASCAGTYVLTQADVDGGPVSRTAVASGTTPAGSPVAAEPTTVVVHPSRVAALTVTNRVETVADTNGSGSTDAGDVVTYRVVAMNAGTVTMTGVTVAAPPGTLDCVPATLAPQASVTCTGTYAVTQADMDDGEVAFTASATGTDPTGARTDAEPSVATAQLPRRATLAVTNEVVSQDVNANGVVDLGDVLTSTAVATNTGTVTLTDVRVTGDCPPATLAPGATATCTSTHTVTQADVDAGEVTSTATATGRAPDGDQVTAEPAEVGTEVAQRSGLAVTNTAAVADRNADGRTNAGDVITYTVGVTNTGTVTLSGVSVTEVVNGRDLGCAAATNLAPGAGTTCTATYAVTTADATAGAVRATATATGATPAGERVTSAPSTVSTEVVAGGTAPPAGQPGTDGGTGHDGGDENLASTGVTAVGQMVVAGLVLFALGLGLLLLNRRRRDS